MCKILMSINPNYVDEILLGNKKYEYRKIRAKKNNIDKIVIYSTFPVMKVVGEVDIEDIMIDTPKNLWEITKNESGVTEEFYNKYYENRNIAIAYKLGNINVYETPKELKEFGINYVPQSFIYLD